MASPAKATILNATNNETLLVSRTRILRQAGYDVYEARNAEETLRLVRNEEPRLVLLSFPHPEALELCRRTKAASANPSTLVLLMTGPLDDLETAEALKGGADEIVPETIDPEALPVIVRTLFKTQTAQTRSREIEARRDAMLSRLPEMLFTAKEYGYNEYASPQFYDYTGCQRGSAEGFGWLAAVHPADVDQSKRRWVTGIKTKKPFVTECRLRRADGVYRWFETRMEPILDSQKVVTKWAGVCIDIDELKRIQAELASTKDMLAAQLEDLTRLGELTMSLATNVELKPVLQEILRAVADLQKAPMGHLMLFDEKESDLYIVASVGLPEEYLKLVGRIRPGEGPCGRAVSERTRVFVEDIEADAFSAPFDVAAEIAGYRSILSTPMISRGGAILGTIATHWPERHHPSDRETALLDLYARYAAHAIENAKLYSEAQEANRLKDEFLVTISHELRTPLNAIIGWTHLFRNRRLDESQAAHALETIERNAKIQAQLIDDLLDVSRIVSGKLQLTLHPMELASVVTTAIETVRPTAEVKHITIATLLRSAGIVLGDAHRLQQVVWNILSNAVKFTPRGGHIDVRLEAENGQVHVKIRDSGKGIKRDFLPFVFERFRQADASSTRTQTGLGLGLAIVRQLVDLHGGTVFAESEGEGRGSVFTVSLPLLASEPEMIPAAQKQGREGAFFESSLDKLRVLVVDDEPETRSVLSLALTERFAAVKTAASAREALSLLERWKPDVLISDIAMPGEDGYSLIEKIREQEVLSGTNLLAVALTAYARKEDRQLALSAGYHEHIAKPVEPEELAAAIARLVSQRNTPRRYSA